ncbi:MAG: DUF4159 domain-containing protein [Verrucomicrobiales bacterium]|nr:DUF4159 domain-containing protein [Verrucomicrobiales bacterium]
MKSLLHGNRGILAWVLLAAGTGMAGAEPKPPDPPPFELPAPKPAQVSSAESLPPLPYPVVPLKRQEKKNPPNPPTLLTRIRTGDLEDWARTPNDLKGMLDFMSSEMNVHFSLATRTFTEASRDVAANPVLYKSGYKPFTLAKAESDALRKYLLSGGTIVFNSLVGNPDAYHSALAAAAQILPERPLYRLRMDHPVFRAFYPVDKVSFRERMVKDGMVKDPYPFLEGIDLDNRTAIFISRWDFSLGWEANPHDSWGYADADARKIGANIFSYVTAMRDAGRSIGKSVELVNPDKKTAGKFRVGQLKHSGVWLTRTAAFPMLLNQFNETTGAPVSFELLQVAADSPAIFEMPFLFLTGTTDFSFTERERANLQRFLANGGVLFAEASDGRPSFDKSFREEMEKLVPGRHLRRLGPGHDLFHAPLQLATVKARPSLAALKKGRIDVEPEMYGIDIDGTLSVIYCPYDLSAGWERAVAPYALGYNAPDATALGLNVLSYVMVH